MTWPFVLDIASCVSPLSECLPVVHIESRRSGLVNEYHLGVLANHCLVEHFLLSYSCYVAVVNQPQYWVKQACLSAVGLTDKAWHSLFVLLLVEIQVSINLRKTNQSCFVSGCFPKRLGSI